MPDLAATAVTILCQKQNKQGDLLELWSSLHHSQPSFGSCWLPRTSNPCMCPRQAEVACGRSAAARLGCCSRVTDLTVSFFSRPGRALDPVGAAGGPTAAAARVTATRAGMTAMAPPGAAVATVAAVTVAAATVEVRLSVLLGYLAVRLPSSTLTCVRPIA